MQRKERMASRRDFLKNTGRIAAASALAGVAIPQVHAAESNTIQVALIGCGARGTGAAANAMAVKQGPIKLVAVADVFADRIEASLKYLKHGLETSGDGTASGGVGDHIDVPPERRFVGFDGYRKAMN